MPGCRTASVICLLVAACSVSGLVGTVADDTGGGGSEASTGVDAETGQPPAGDVLLDIGAQADLCQAFDGQDEFQKCKITDLAEAFDPELQWAWQGPGPYTESFVTPLVANLTDDDDNGVVDLCDRPDVVVLASPPLSNTELAAAGNVARLFVLDGETGDLHVQLGDVLPAYTPALGDIDGDGTVEIVAVADATGTTGELRGRIVVFHADGTSTPGRSTFTRVSMGAVALADLEGDGSAEIIVDYVVLDRNGEERFSVPPASQSQLPIATDLDGDGRLEVVWGHYAIDAEGNALFPRHQGFAGGYPHVANFDDDPGPEILVASDRGLVMLDSDGTLLFGPATPQMMDAQGVDAVNAWRRPAAIHDIYGDSRPEIVISAGDFFMAIDYVLDRGFEIAWQTRVATGSAAAATAFDFLGDATAEALYADTTTLWMFDLAGRDVIAEPHASATKQELPIVADVDNDGSAEIVVVSNAAAADEPPPTVQVWGEGSDGWVPARRIWNQHTYHVTNVEEDGSLPTREVPAHRRLNTFRTNVQIEGGAICKPEP
jgi:hypothetical protein